MNTSVELLVHSINALLNLLRDPAWDGVAALLAIVLALQTPLRRLLALLAEKLREISMSEANELLSEVLDSVTLPYEHAEHVPQPARIAELEELREGVRLHARHDADTMRVANLRNLISQVRQQYGGRCMGCNSNEKVQCHHIAPLYMVESNTIRNMLSLCARCHRAMDGVIA